MNRISRRAGDIQPTRGLVFILLEFVKRGYVHGYRLYFYWLRYRSRTT